MFEAFTAKAKNVLSLAQEECRYLSHSSVTPAHFLLGLIAEGTSAAGKCLRGIGFDLTNARLEVERVTGRGDAPSAVGDIAISDGTRSFIDAAWHEARTLGHNYVGPEHLLLAVTTQTQCIEVVCAMGSRPEIVRTEMLRLLGESKPAAPTS
jgi:ATP-dependent Clp protease ATP-binding subunit ClpC